MLGVCYSSTDTRQQEEEDLALARALQASERDAAQARTRQVLSLLLNYQSSILLWQLHRSVQFCMLKLKSGS